MAAEHDSGQVPRNALPHLVAPVTALEPREIATIKMVDGTTCQVVKGTYWRLGNTVMDDTGLVTVQTDRGVQYVVPGNGLKVGDNVKCTTKEGKTACGKTS